MPHCGNASLKLVPPSLLKAARVAKVVPPAPPTVEAEVWMIAVSGFEGV